jgi:hypothetical protein
MGHFVDGRYERSWEVPPVRCSTDWEFGTVLGRAQIQDFEGSGHRLGCSLNESSMLPETMVGRCRRQKPRSHCPPPRPATGFTKTRNARFFSRMACECGNSTGNVGEVQEAWRDLPS